MLKPIFPVLAYVIGSLSPSFFLVHCNRGESIFNLGSGNAGAGNVFKILGFKWGMLVGVMDFLKGVIVVLLARVLGSEIADPFFIMGAVLCVCGHNWSVFLRFKGGTGLATSIGILIMFYPIYILISVAAGFLFEFFVPMELAVFLGGSIYIIAVIFLEKNLWIGLLPLLLGIPITIKRIQWKKNKLREISLQKQ